MSELSPPFTAPAPPPPPTSADVRIAFDAERPVFRRLVLRGAALELVTVGFYRFWLATDMRRHLWSHTAAGGDTLEYTGTAKELLIGFLFALAILVPIYLLYFLAGLEAERIKAFASFPLGVFFYLFAQFAVYRARRYRLTRTVWRGVRFSMSGSGLSYAWRVALWTLLVAITFGLTLPWRQAALERFKMRHTSYGNLPGAFVATGGQFFKRGWGLWLAAAAVVLSPFLLALLKSPILSGVAGLVEIIAVPFIYAAYKATEWRWWVGGIRFGEVAFASSLQRGALFGTYWKVIGWTLLIGLLLSAWIGGAVAIAVAVAHVGALTAQKAMALTQQISVMAAIAVGYLLAILAFWVVMRMYLVHDVWRRVADTSTVMNLAAADNVTAQGELVGALGEGLTDSLDVVGF